MKRRGPAPLFVIAAALLAAAGLAMLLGLDAAAEKPASADRFAVLLGAGLGTGALSLAATTFFLVEVQRRLAVRRLKAVQALHDVIEELAEAVLSSAAPEVEDPVPVQRLARSRGRARRTADR